jgi:DNA-binding response OmpR family regulator
MQILRVLIVEDDPLIATLLAQVITELGYEVCGMEATEAGSIETALREKPDLMIVDDGLGEGSGVAAVSQILESAFIPHVFISAHRLSDRLIHPSAVVLQKPFRAKEMIQAINSVILASTQR